jgi:hypothetical protein
MKSQYPDFGRRAGIEQTIMPIGQLVVGFILRKFQNRASDPKPLARRLKVEHAISGGQQGYRCCRCCREEPCHHFRKFPRIFVILSRQDLQSILISLSWVVSSAYCVPKQVDRSRRFIPHDEHGNRWCDFCAVLVRHLRPHCPRRPSASLSHGCLSQAALPGHELVTQSDAHTQVVDLFSSIFPWRRWQNEC